MIPLPSGAPEWAHAFDIRLVHGQVPCEGRVLERTTVRAVVMRGDELLLVRYPSKAAFLSMLADPEYRAATEHRTAALADSRLIATTPR